MKLIQILLSQAEAGAETYFEKVASAFASDPDIDQRLIIEALPPREARLRNARIDYRTLPMGIVSKPLLYNFMLKRHVAEFAPDLIVTWVNRASRKCPPTDAVVVGRLGGYYDINNYRKCDHLIVNTPDLVRHVTEHGWPNERVSMISNFGELPPALHVDDPLPSIPSGHKVLLTLGRLHEKKAQDTAIKALARIPGVTLLIAGSGEMRNELEELARTENVTDRVQFLGLRKDIRELFKLADICLFPSRFEPLGNVVLEAWATGTPIIAAASTGPTWLITHEQNGLLFPVDDVDRCAAEVNRLLQDPELAAKLVHNGAEKYQREFSEPVIIEQYKRLFTELITAQRAVKLTTSHS